MERVIVDGGRGDVRGEEEGCEGGKGRMCGGEGGGM